MYYDSDFGQSITICAHIYYTHARHAQTRIKMYTLLRARYTRGYQYHSTYYLILCSMPKRRAENYRTILDL